MFQPTQNSYFEEHSPVTYRILGPNFSAQDLGPQSRGSPNFSIQYRQQSYDEYSTGEEVHLSLSCSGDISEKLLLHQCYTIVCSRSLSLPMPAFTTGKDSWVPAHMAAEDFGRTQRLPTVHPTILL